eukprot:189084_1
MSNITIDSLPDGVLCHIISYILAELRKLPLVCIRFREICLMPHWYTKFMLQLDATHFIKPAPPNVSPLPLSFQSGNKNQIIIQHPQLFISSYTNSINNNNNKLISLPWQHFSLFDLYITPNIINKNILFQQCIDIILPYFTSIEISPTSKKQSDIIYFTDELFNNTQYKSIYHLSLNGKIQYYNINNTLKPG